MKGGRIEGQNRVLAVTLSLLLCPSLKTSLRDGMLL
jgi:hypothetical protein